LIAGRLRLEPSSLATEKNREALYRKQIVYLVGAVNKVNLLKLKCFSIAQLLYGLLRDRFVNQERNWKTIRKSPQNCIFITNRADVHPVTMNAARRISSSGNDGKNHKKNRQSV
jgi:hypothetical protein